MNSENTSNANLPLIRENVPLTPEDELLNLALKIFYAESPIDFRQTLQREGALKAKNGLPPLYNELKHKVFKFLTFNVGVLVDLAAICGSRFLAGKEVEALVDIRDIYLKLTPEYEIQFVGDPFLDEGKKRTQILAALDMAIGLLNMECCYFYINKIFTLNKKKFYFILNEEVLHLIKNIGFILHYPQIVSPDDFSRLLSDQIRDTAKKVYGVANAAIRQERIKFADRYFRVDLYRHKNITTDISCLFTEFSRFSNEKWVAPPKVSGGKGGRMGYGDGLKKLIKIYIRDNNVTSPEEFAKEFRKIANKHEHIYCGVRFYWFNKKNEMKCEWVNKEQKTIKKAIKDRQLKKFFEEAQKELLKDR